MNMQALVERRQELKAQVAELQDAIKDIDYQIQAELGGELGSLQVGQYAVSVAVKRTFQASRVEDYLPASLTKKEREALKKPAQYDSAKVKAMYPEVYEASCSVSAPFVTVKG